MVTSGLSCKKALVGTVWAISLLLYMHDWDLTGKYPHHGSHIPLSSVITDNASHFL